MGILDSFLHPGDAYKKAEEPINNAWNQAQGYGKPYWQQGLDQYGRLSGAENALLDPEALESKWASGYQTSPYAKQMLEQNRTSGLDAASSMGLMGSSAALGNIQTGAGNIVNQDRQNYLNDLMQKYMQGIGIGQNIYGIGANTGSNLMSGALKTGEDLSGLEYGRASAGGDMLGKILGGVGTGVANYFAPGSGSAIGSMFGGGGGMPNYARDAIHNSGNGSVMNSYL